MKSPKVSGALSRSSWRNRNDNVCQNPRIRYPEMGGINMTGTVAAVGVSQLPFKSRYANKSYQALAYEATTKALNDARLTVKDIDAVVYSIYCPLMMRQDGPDIYIHDYLGFQGKPSVRVAAGAATGGCAMFSAYMQIASGQADTVLLLGIQKGSDFFSFATRSRGDGFNKAMSISGDTIWTQPVAVGGTPPGFTVRYLVPHMEKFGSPTVEQVAKVSVKNHKNALVNPNAQLKVDLTLDDVLYSRVIAWPTTMYECCLQSDGAAAMVLTSAEGAKKSPHLPVWMSGVGVSYSPHRLDTSSLGRMLGVNDAAKRAYQMAGIKNPSEELDVVELHDLISGIEVITYEELGLCPLGEGGRLVDEGVVEKTGSLPVNPSGGRVACGHVAGVSEISSACDVVLQLREEAGNIQVPIRRGKGLVETICGEASLCTVTTFERRN